jgi:thiamine-monophosphate kinase
MTDRLRDRGERALLDEIQRLIPANGRVRLGPGDDAAVLAPHPAPLLVTTDALVEDVHFRSQWLTGAALGRRAFEVSASDIAAMGGRVRGAVLAVATPATLPVRRLRAIVRGVRDAATRAGGALIGGNLASATELSLTVTVVGAAVARPVTRAGGRPGDQLFVTGTLGGAAFGLRSLLTPRSIPAAVAVRCWRKPVARLRAGETLARRGIAAAMIDVSDGLLIDAERLCEASGVGARIHVDRLPLSPTLRRVPLRDAQVLALTGGEDYELLFAVRPNRRAALRAAATALGCPATWIGELVRDRGITMVDGDVDSAALAGGGHQHFRRRGATPHAVRR